jgi:hypothetical protein
MDETTQERTFRLRDEWAAVLFIGIVLLAVIGGGILLFFGV